MLETGTCSSDLWRVSRSIYGSKKVLAEILAKVELNYCGVVRVTYDHVHLRAGLKSACARWKCAPSDVRATLDLARVVGVLPGNATAGIDRMNLGPVSEVLAAREEVIVHLGRRALEDMLLSTLEGYLVPRTRRTNFTEVYGLCLGMVRNVPIHRQGGGKHWVRHVQVDRVIVQLRARATGDSVWPNPKSLETELMAAKILFPHLEIIGDFHSHPYKKAAIVHKWRGWEPSKADYEYNKGWVTRLRQERHDPKVAFIVAIGQKQKAFTQKTVRPTLPHVGFMQIDRSLVAIGVYRILADSRYDSSRIKLRLPTIYEA
jgi:hypothetical protein